MYKRSWVAVIGWIILCELAGVVGSIFSISAIPAWYMALQKPALNPPNSVFGPVWITLYALMGISAFLVWRQDSSTRLRRWALSLFLLQLGVNTIWSIVFFGGHALGASLIIILFLWCLIVGTILLFWRISRTAAVLLVPYLLWVSFATYLTYGIWRLN